MGSLFKENISNNIWYIFSYSKLQKIINLVEIDSVDLEINNVFFEDKNLKKIQKLNQHTFMRGIIPGIFLHRIFEKIDFTCSINIDWLNYEIFKEGIKLDWVFIIKEWIEKILYTPLNYNKNFTLSNITFENRNSEFKFYLSINSIIDSFNLDKICRNYDLLSASCPILIFPKIRGILKGFIDLVFRWEGRYYILDYKSNWLGENSTFYTKELIKKSIIINRYDIQYQLYTLVLHRFLQYRLADYNYDRDFGGVFYLFIRGIDSKYFGNGIYYCRPQADFIFDLDKFFNN